MKYSAILVLFVAALIFSAPGANAQVKINLKEKINREANKRANKKTDETVNKGFN
jgi:archaellum component FlaG (FlaF/FlaG flagellin family)